MSEYTPLPELRCPYCMETMLWAEPVDPSRSTIPSDGAVSICMECVGPAIFVNGPFGLALRKPTRDELVEIMAYIGEPTMKFKMMRAQARDGRTPGPP